MSNTSKTILFFGTEEFSLASLAALIDGGYKIGAVITKPDSRKGRGRQLTPPSVKTLALKHNIPVWQPQNLSEIVDGIKQFDEPAGVLVSFGKIIPQSIINLFTPGIINVHPSLLPQYRGPSPIESAIANGDTHTGVSIMQLDAKMDAGPVFSQTTEHLLGTETKPALYEHLARRGAEELVRVLPKILSGSLQAAPQDDSLATYCSLLSKEMTSIDPTTAPAAVIERRIRAHLDYPKSRLPFYDETPIITKSHVSDSKNQLTVTCANDTYLQIDELVAPSGKTITAQEYLRGRRL